MERFGIDKGNAQHYMPPYEWYNRQISEWTREEELKLVNFTPGTGSNQDWTYPELGAVYVSADKLVHNILDYEKAHGMNGFILLIHYGTDPRREDKLYNRLDILVTELEKRGYVFRRIDE